VYRTLQTRKDWFRITLTISILVKVLVARINTPLETYDGHVRQTRFWGFVERHHCVAAGYETGRPVLELKVHIFKVHQSGGHTARCERDALIRFDKNRVPATAGE